MGFTLNSGERCAPAKCVYVQPFSVYSDTYYCTRNAFAQALKVSEPAIDGKICKGTASSSETESGQCRNGSGSHSNAKGLSTAFNNVEAASSNNWPNGGGSHKGTKGTNVANVTADLISLTKDEKAVVAGHRDVFSSYNKIPRCEVLVQGVDNLLTISPHSYPRLWE